LVWSDVREGVRHGEGARGGELGGGAGKDGIRVVETPFFLHEISVSFEVIERSDQLLHALVQTSENIFPAVAATVYLIAEGVYFERIS
jgi:hypothetical protein